MQHVRQTKQELEEMCHMQNGMKQWGKGNKLMGGTGVIIFFILIRNNLPCLIN